MSAEMTLDTFDLIQLIAAISSIMLALVAITLSILFYWWSRKSNKSILNVSKHIEKNTDKIESLFDRLYSDTFQVMKGNVEAMQQQLYDKTISSGDSSLTKEESIEEIILSLVAKSKVVTRENIKHFFKKVYKDKDITNLDIQNAIERLKERDAIYINENLISIADTQKDSSESDNEG